MDVFPPFLTWLLYFTSFGAVLALLASAVALVIWVPAKLVRWLMAPPPETEAAKPEDLRLQLDRLKRAGQ